MQPVISFWVLQARQHFVPSLVGSLLLFYRIFNNIQDLFAANEFHVFNEATTAMDFIFAIKPALA
jgi:hypothetical protein